MSHAGSLPRAFDFDFFRERPAPPHRVLFVDYDGTLAPFQPKRNEAVPYPGMIDLLKHMSQSNGARVVVVSGRQAEEVRQFLDPEVPIEIWGAHGWERVGADGRARTWHPGAAVRAMLSEAESHAGALVESHLIEIKPGSIALHTRPLAERDRKRIEGEIVPVWEKLGRHAGAQVLHFDGGYELRDPSRTKGTAVETVRAELPHDTHYAYLGDDATDEDAFALLGADDWPILVAAHPRPSHARLHLIPPQQVRDFLDRWNNWSHGVSQG